MRRASKGILHTIDINANIDFKYIAKDLILIPGAKRSYCDARDLGGECAFCGDIVLVKIKTLKGHLLSTSAKISDFQTIPFSGLSEFSKPHLLFYRRPDSPTTFNNTNEKIQIP